MRQNDRICVWMFMASLLLLLFQPIYAGPAPGRKMLFTPPLRGAPSTRVGGGVRGGGSGDMPLLHVLAPPSTGLTANESPSLFWFQSKPAEEDMMFELVLNSEDDLVVQIQFGKADSFGIQSLDLEGLGIQLERGMEYEWIVSIVSDFDERTTDVSASTLIQCTEPSAELTRKLAEASEKDRPLVYAAEGIWYDALESLSDQIKEDPTNKELIALRADLLEQVDLKDEAQYERDRIK